jgi:membrane associated rhomboid family serine protease
MDKHREGFFNSTPVAANLIIINVICWVASIVFKRIDVDLFRMFALHYPASDDFNLIQLVSYMFLHDTGSIAHLFFNMFGVYMFGRVLENVWGGKRFLIYYMATGVGAAVINILVAYIRISWIEGLMPAGDIDAVYQQGLDALNRGMNFTDPAMASLNIIINGATLGASGAIFGVLLAFGMLFPNAPLYIMLIPIPIKAKYFVIGYGLIELTFGLANLSSDNVAHFAHLGGMIFGYLMIVYWRKRDAANHKYF